MSKVKQKAGFSLLILPLVLIIFALFQGMSTIGNIRVIEDKVSSLVKTNLSIQASSLGGWMGTLVESLEWFCSFPEFQEGDWKGMEAVIFQQRGRMGNTLSEVFLVNFQGEMITSNQAKLFVNDRDYFQAIIKEGKKHFVSGGMISRSDGNLTFLVAVPLYRDEQIYGLLGGFFDLGEVSSWAISSDFGWAGRGSVQDGEGTLIGYENPARVLEKNFSSHRNTEGFVYLAPIPLTKGWNVETLVRAQDIQAPLWVWFWVQIGVFLVVYGLLIFLGKNLTIKSQVIMQGTFLGVIILILGFWNAEVVKHEITKWTGLKDQIQISTDEKNTVFQTGGLKFKLKVLSNLKKLQLGREPEIQKYIQQINKKNPLASLYYFPIESGKGLNRSTPPSEEVVLKDQFGTPKGTLSLGLPENTHGGSSEINRESQVPTEYPWFVIFLIEGMVILITGVGILITHRKPKVVHSPEIRSFQTPVVLNAPEDMDDFEDY